MREISTYIQINNQWIKYQYNELLNFLQVSKAVLDRALNSKQGWGRVKASDKTIYIVSKTQYEIPTIDEQINIFTTWWLDNKDRFEKEQIKKNSKNYDVEEILDFVSDTFIYVLNQIKIGYGVNNYSSAMLFKIDCIIKDDLKRGNLKITKIVENEYYNPKDETSEEYIEIEERIPLKVKWLDLQDNVESVSFDDFQLYKENGINNATHSFFDNELTIEEKIIKDVNNDVLFNILKEFIVVNFSLNDYNLWIEYKNNYHNSNGVSCKYKELLNKYGDLLKIKTMSSIKLRLKEVDFSIEVNKSNLLNTHSNFKYKSFDDSDMTECW